MLTTVDTLVAFGEFLDQEKLIVSPSASGNDESFEDLAKRFIEWWNESDAPCTAREPLAGSDINIGGALVEGGLDIGEKR